MFYGNQNNNNQGNSVNVNTSFYTSYSDTAMVSVGGWNRLLSIKIQPAVGKDANGVTQYAANNDQHINTGITQENALALLEGYAEITKAIEEKRPAKVSISMGGDNNNGARKVLSIGYDGSNAYLEIATNVDQNGIAAAGNVIKHVFNKKSYMLDYNAADGSGIEVPVEADLFNFMEKVKACQNLIPTQAHAANFLNATKASYAKNQNNHRGYNNTNNSYSGSENSGGYSAQSSTYSGDMSGFLPLS